MASSLSAVAEVDIDPTGIFKYILIELRSESADDIKMLVRGYGVCNYHVDVNDLVVGELEKLKLQGKITKWDLKVVGGGRIIHDSSNKTIKVYGYSQAYGKADHAVTVDLLKKVYSDYVKQERKLIV